MWKLDEKLSNRASWSLLLLLVAADLAFIALGIVYECGFINLVDVCNNLNFDSYFSLTRDRGYAEIYQYIKEFWLIILFGFLAINKSLTSYLGWFFLSIYILLDDALEIHENLGKAIANQLSFISLFNLRPEDYGELAVFSTVGIIFLFWLSLSYRASGSQERKNFKSLINILLGLAFFAVLIDLVHILADSSSFWKSTLGIIEDGGEHILMSFLLVFVWSISIKIPEFKDNKLSKTGTIYSPYK